MDTTGPGKRQIGWEPWAGANASAGTVTHVSVQQLESGDLICAPSCASYPDTPLSDADVDRIARRTLKLQKQLLAGVRALHEMVDQTDPNDPIGVALTRAGLAVKP